LTATHIDRLLPLTGALALVAARLTELANVREVVRELLTLSKQRMTARSSRPVPTFVLGDFVFLSSKGLHIHSQKCKHVRDQRLGPFQVIEKVGLKSYRLKLPLGCRLHPVFHCNLLSKASNSTPLRHRHVEIESDHNEHVIVFISMLKLTIGQIVVVFIFNSQLMLFDMMSVSGCYLNKWKIVKSYMCFYHQMFGLNSPI